MTKEEIKAFQRGQDWGLPPPIDFLGKPLKVDGDLGPRTGWALDMSKLQGWRQAVVRSALLKNGRKEEGTNRGDWIDADMAICRLDNDVDGPGPSEDGWPWCAAFACARLAEHSPHKFTPDASVRRLSKQLHRVSASQALPGDLAYFLRRDGTGHVGIAIACAYSWTASVDGNLGNQVRVVRYPSHDRKYMSVEPPQISPRVPSAIRPYTGSTR